MYESFCKRRLAIYTTIRHEKWFKNHQKENKTSRIALDFDAFTENRHYTYHMGCFPCKIIYKIVFSKGAQKTAYRDVSGSGPKTLKPSDGESYRHFGYRRYKTWHPSALCYFPWLWQLFVLATFRLGFFSSAHKKLGIPGITRRLTSLGVVFPLFFFFNVCLKLSTSSSNLFTFNFWLLWLNESH